jgi:hypothetical protein
LPAAAAPALNAEDELHVLGDLQEPLTDQAVAAAILPGFSALPLAQECAAFAAGRVAVGVVFLESSGAIDVNVEDWSRADPLHPGDRRENVLARIAAALAWWNGRAPAGTLELYMPEAGGRGAPVTVGTGYEPIKRARSEDHLWRRQAMAKLGTPFPSGADKADAERSYADSMRRAGNAHWGVVIYVVDSLRDNDGVFAGGGIGYTRDLFGPYVVLPYDNGTYGFRNFEAVVAHEIGHVFGALDEYKPPSAGYPSTGALTGGYLGVRNSNAESGGTTDHLCLMRGGQQTLDAFRSRALCPATIGQTGLRDRDGDGIADVVDTSPRFSDGPQETLADGTLRVKGTVRERPCPRGTINFRTYFRHDISIKVPHDVRFRVDGGAWQAVTPVDGGFDDAVEDWVVTTSPLDAGHHVLEMEGTTGQPTGFARDIWAGPTPVDLDLAAGEEPGRRSVTITAGSSVRLRAATTSSGVPVPYLPEVRVVRVSGGAVEAGRAAGTNRRGLWSGVFSPQRNVSYEARFPGRDTFSPATSPMVTVGVRFAMTAQRSSGPFRPGDRVRVTGSLKPVTSGVRILLEESRDDGKTWRQAATTRSSAKSTFAMAYTVVGRGSVLLRARAVGDAQNLGSTKRLAAFRVS